MSNQELIFLNYLSKVFENLDDAILLFELDKTQSLQLLLVNNGFYNMTGFHKMPIKKLEQELESASDLDFMQRLQEVIATKTLTESQTTQTTPNGTITAYIKIIPVLTSLGEVTHLVLLARDISEQVAKDARIQELETQLGAK